MRENRYWRHFTEPRSAVGLGLFRIVFALTLLGEVGQLYSLRHLVFDEVPYQVANRLFTAPLFALWMLCLVCLMVGLFTRTAAVLNYLMTLATFSTFRYWEYHVDYVYTGVNCFVMFVPVGRAVSVDAWLGRRRAARLGLPAPSGEVARLHYDALILVGIALVYFDSVFYKLASPMWTSGLGLWRPASLPHNTHWNVGWLLDIKPLMQALSHITLVFESLFLLLMWSDRLRPWLFAVGVGLHLGIVVMFPIPWFGFAVFALYLLLIPDEWWQALATRRRISASQAGPVVRDAARFDSVASRAVVAVTIVVCVSQLIMTSVSDLSRQITSRIGGESVRQSVERLAVRIHSPARILFGVTRHPVFMDFHFDGYESFYTLVSVEDDGTKTWLPMAAESGQGRLGWSGRLWVNYTWRVSNPQPDLGMMRRGYKQITAWWLGRQGHRLDDARFLVMRRPCDPCNGWSAGYYQRQLEHDWQPVGAATWMDGEFAFQLTPDAFSRPSESMRMTQSPLGAKGG
ncbi:MAG: HTTM domain-containing protein [Planctomycetaceae bacterium]